MPEVDKIYECWNCGNTYNLTVTEYCTKCGQYKEDEPREEPEMED